jgi:tetratricopeptide (TPR) repeat protein
VPDQDALLLYSSWAEFAFNIANIDTLEHATQGMLQAGYRRQSATLIGHGYLAQAAVSDLRDQPAQGLLQLEDARKILSGINDPNDPAWLKYHFQRGGFFILQNHYEEGIDEFEQSIQSLQDTHDPRLIEARSNLRYRLGMAYTLNGWPAKGYRQAELLMDDSRRTLSHAARARGFTIMAICEYYLARFPAALEHGAMALRMVTPMQNSRLEGTIRANQAQTELALGHIDQAWEQAALALAAGREGGFERVISEALRIRGDIHRLFGNFETAEALYRAGSDSAGDNYTKMDSMHRLGFVMARSGRVEEGLAIIDQAIEVCQKNELNLYLLSAQAAKARILLLNGRNQESAELARQMVIQAAEREIPMMRPQGYLILGSQALIEGHADEAGQKILASMRIAREIQHPLLEVTAIELALVSLKKQEQDLCQLHERLQMLLDGLDKNTRHPDLRPAFEQFAEKYKNL